MKRALTLLALLLSACAATPPAEPPRVERLTAEQLAAALPQPVATVSLDDIVAMSHAGKPADAIIARLKESHSRYRLAAGQIIDLHAQGVAREVLDYLVEAERQAIFADMANDLAKREQTCRDSLEQEVRLCRLQCLNSWPAMPFGGCWPPHSGYPFWRCF